MSSEEYKLPTKHEPVICNIIGHCMYKYDVAILPDDVQFSLITFSDSSNPSLYSYTNDAGNDGLYMDMSGANKSMPGYVVMNRPSMYQNPCTRDQIEVISPGTWEVVFGDLRPQDLLLRLSPVCSEGPTFYILTDCTAKIPSNQYFTTCTVCVK